LQTTGFQPFSLSVGGEVRRKLLNPPAFSWWSFSNKSCCPDTPIYRRFSGTFASIDSSRHVCYGIVCSGGIFRRFCPSDSINDFQASVDCCFAEPVSPPNRCRSASQPDPGSRCLLEMPRPPPHSMPRHCNRRFVCWCRRHAQPSRRCPLGRLLERRPVPRGIVPRLFGCFTTIMTRT
jgi:hypothetical protein